MSAIGHNMPSNLSALSHISATSTSPLKKSGTHGLLTTSLRPKKANNRAAVAPLSPQLKHHLQPEPKANDTHNQRDVNEVEPFPTAPPPVSGDMDATGDGSSEERPRQSHHAKDIDLEDIHDLGEEVPPAEQQTVTVNANVAQPFGWARGGEGARSPLEVCRVDFW